MKRLSTIMMCLLAMMAASMSVKAQEVTITLFPGWNWISYPKAETQDISTALGDFEPVNGDMLKSQFGNAVYSNGYWRGSVTHFIPGWGYKYYSNRTEVVSFVFGEAAPQLIVTTAEPTEITAISAISGGSLTSSDGSYIVVLEKGICWATHPNPTAMNDFHTENGGGSDSFTAEMTELSPETVYYVRAYAVTADGTFYGDELSFTTVFMGAINGLFSISSTRQVYFSQGNLQYIGSAVTPYWKFADNQWDYLGDNGQGSTSQIVDRDLFCWGTSGYNHGANCYQPWSTSTNSSDYYAYGSSTYNLYDQTGQADWGYNPISNGGDQSNQWRTLTTNEWSFVFNTRSTASGIRYAKAKVNNVNGVILLPDDWSSSYYTLSNTNNSGANFIINTITTEQWIILEQHGAVFLPAAGKRSGTSVYVNSSNYYWSASCGGGGIGAYGIFFNDGSLYTFGGSRNIGSSVRLVRDVQ